jgi:hypothetical protein
MHTIFSSKTKDGVTDAAVGKLCVALGGTVTGTLSLDPLLTVEYVISDAINKGRGLAPHPQLVSSIPSPVLVLTKARCTRRNAQRLRDDFASNLPKKAVDGLVSVPRR